MTQWVVDVELDARGLHCPLPILKTKRALNNMQSAQIIRVVCTDQGSLRDFVAFCRQTGNELIAQETQGEEFIHWLKRR